LSQDREFEYQFVHPRTKLQAGRNVCAPQDHS